MKTMTKPSSFSLLLPALLLCCCLLAACRASDLPSAAAGAHQESVPACTVFSPLPSLPDFLQSAEPVPNLQRKEETFSLEPDTTITFSENSVLIQGEGVSLLEDTLTITQTGTYRLTGTWPDGSLIVDAKDCDVTIILDNAHISCSFGCPLYIYKASQTTVITAPGSENSLTDCPSYDFSRDKYKVKKDEPGACLYSSADLILQGSGSLTIHGQYKDGIFSKGALAVYSLPLTVFSAAQGICGKDSLYTEDASLTVTSDNKSLKTSGSITLVNSSLDLHSGDDALHAEKDIRIFGGAIDISCHDDALHATSSLAVFSGTLTIRKCHEGLESAQILINDGQICITSDEDGINAGGKEEPQHAIWILGGTTTIDAGGDGLDANGSIVMTGGTLLIRSTGEKDGALDYDDTFHLTGGTLIAFGSGDEPQAPSASSQPVIFTSFSPSIPSGSSLSIAAADETETIFLPIETAYLVFSSPTFQAGESCRLYLNDSLLLEPALH